MQTLKSQLRYRKDREGAVENLNPEILRQNEQPVIWFMPPHPAVSSRYEKKADPDEDQTDDEKETEDDDYDYDETVADEDYEEPDEEEWGDGTTDSFIESILPAKRPLWKEHVWRARQTIIQTDRFYEY